MLCDALNPDPMLTGGSLTELGEPFLSQVRPATR